MWSNKEDKFKSRMIISILVIVVILAGLSARLYYLQIVKSEEYYNLALKQRGREIDLYPKRGLIFDRNLLPLTNEEKTDIIILPRNTLFNNVDLYNNIVNNTTLTSKELSNIINSNKNLLEIPLKEKIPIAENALDIFIVEKVNRYNSKKLLSHVIGYVNKAENSGESGIERVYDEFLRTTDEDYLLVEYDKNRSMILGGSYFVNQDKNSIDPSAVQLTIDIKIQEVVEKILDKEKLNGAVVVSEIKSGEILALASRPNFNQDEIEKHFQSKDMALYNKAIQGKYPPGSIFKIVVLLTALEDNRNLIQSKYICPGFEEVNGVKISCAGIHGELNLKEGFTKSCNSVFIQLGKQLGAEKIMDMAHRLGLGETINIGLLEEIRGNLPSGNQLLGAAIGNISIGQGEIEVTPIQITNIMMIIANSGMKKQMSLVKGITNNNGHMIKEYKKVEDRRIISRNSSEEVLAMLIDVVKNGTAKELDLERYGAAGGKTGSAEGVLNKKNVIHGWFAGFYPAVDPQYVITVFIEDAASGSKTAAPIFEEIIKEISIIYP